MPPEAKKTITKIEEIICENCLLAANEPPRTSYSTNPDKSFSVCHNMWNESYLDGTKGIGNYCSGGLWIVAVTCGRPSVVNFDLAYSYLMEIENAKK